MNNNVKKIDEIKYSAEQLIQDNLYREITPETKYNISGIYMIYIDNFSSEEIVPIYIGQSKNIQKRYKDHLCEILALNRLSYDEYYKYFFSKSSSFYEGRFKACKIFKYMMENNCTLQDFHMIILEEVEIACLEEKEQEYFQRLLPSFFGFNQLNSFLKRLAYRFSNLQMDSLELDNYLNILLDDVKGIYSYYKYGFTQFNFEHSVPKNITFLKENVQIKNDTLLKYNEVKLIINELCNLYKLDIKKGEIEKLNEDIRRSNEIYKIAGEEHRQALSLLKEEVIQKFKGLNIYTNKIPINNFIDSIFDNEKDKYKERFYRYLDSKDCELDFYEIFDDRIKSVKKALSKLNNKRHALDSKRKILKENENKRYKMIFPSCQFGSFTLGDRSNNFSIKIDENHGVLNTCYIQIYISNNARNRSLDFRKEPFIIRFDYSYIDYEGNRVERKYYIDNETTKNCRSGIKYFEKHYYDTFTINPERFKISSLIDNEIDNSFISTLAEYRHGINDYTVKDKNLINLSTVLNEVQQLANEETQFSINASESYRCLEICMINEGLQNNDFVKKLLTKKLPRIKKSRKS